METKIKAETGEIAQATGCISMKYEPKNEAKHNFQPFASKFELDEIKSERIKVEHCSESDSSGSDVLTNNIQSELVAFREIDPHRNPDQNHRLAVMLEKIPKIETEITGNKPASSSNSNQECDLYNIEMNSDSYSNFDPQRDPFADSDSECDPSFSQPPAPQSHTSNFLNISKLRKQLKSKAIKCPMPNCEKTFKVKSYLQDHLRLVHSELRPIKCPEPNSGKVFRATVDHKGHLVCRPSKEKTVNNSVKAINLNSRPFKCQECPSTFANLSNLTDHVKKSHKSQRFYKCPMPRCEVVCKNNGNLQDHLRRVHLA